MLLVLRMLLSEDDGECSGSIACLITFDDDVDDNDIGLFFDSSKD
jgi:hypothetical protein